MPSILRCVVLKTCLKCLVEKPRTDFYKDKNTKDGLQRWCKDCGYLANKRSTDKNRARENICIPAFKTCPKCDCKKPSSAFGNSKKESQEILESAIAYLKLYEVQ